MTDIENASLLKEFNFLRDTGFTNWVKMPENVERLKLASPEVQAKALAKRNKLCPEVPFDLSTQVKAPAEDLATPDPTAPIENDKPAELTDEQAAIIEGPVTDQEEETTTNPVDGFGTDLKSPKKDKDPEDAKGNELESKVERFTCNRLPRYTIAIGRKEAKFNGGSFSTNDPVLIKAITQDPYFNVHIFADNPEL